MQLKAIAENILERIALTLNLAPLPLVHTQVAFNAARAIMAAAELGIFEALGTKPHTAVEVAGICNTHAEATRHLLDCLTGIGYLQWRQGRYRLRPRYYKWLLQDHDSNLIAKLRFQINEWNWLAGLENYIRDGRPLDLHTMMNKDQWTSYQQAMRDLSVNAARELANKWRMPQEATRMLDIGGSHGLFSLELCRKYPGLQSTILELPAASEPANNIAAQHPASPRVQYITGNALTDDLGEEVYDIVMINNVVHHFTAAQNEMLAKKVARALKRGGVYAIGEFVQGKKAGSGGAVTATSGLYFAFTSASGTWSQSEIYSWQMQAGLTPLKAIPILALPGWKMMLAMKKECHNQ